MAAVELTFDVNVEARASMLIELRRAGSGQVLSAVSALSSFVQVEATKATISFPVTHVLAGPVYVTVESGAFVSKSDGTPFSGVSGMAWAFSYQGEPRLRLASAPPPVQCACGLHRLQRALANAAGHHARGRPAEGRDGGRGKPGVRIRDSALLP